MKNLESSRNGKKAESMTDRKYIYIAGVAALSGSVALLILILNYINYFKALNEYFFQNETFKQYVVQNIAIYEDYRNKDIEQELRTHLLLDHLNIAQQLKLEQAVNSRDVEKLKSGGLIKFVESGLDIPYYFYNVPKENRYLRDFTLQGLNLLSARFNQKLFEKLSKMSGDKYQKLDEKVLVKLAISSAMRPVQYQKNLRNRNGNASVESTHSYGISFDIFYDEFFIRSQGIENSFKRDEFEKIRRFHGFAQGNALRRQFQTVLSKTLIELQNENKLYAILETNQRCYHITILP